MTVKEEIFQHLFEAAEIARFSPEEKEQYEESLKSYRDLKNVIDTAYDEGKMEGILEGEVRGKIEGKIETARNLKKLGVPNQVIKEATGLTDEEIAAL